MEQLHGVGPALAERLVGLGVARVADLLFHLPTRYEDRTRLVPFDRLEPGISALTVGRVEDVEMRRGRRRSLLIWLTDGTGRLSVRLFHFSQAQIKRLRPGTWLRLFGEVRPGPEMVHPEYRQVDGPRVPDITEARLTPVYPAAAGVSQQRLRGAVDQALALLEEPEAVPELLPEAIRRPRALPPLGEALRLLHHPEPGADPARLATGRHPVQRRLAFEELLTHQLSLRGLRRRARECKAPALTAGEAAAEQFVAGLPFEITGAQQRVLEEVLADLGQPRPMLRLIQGDVGSGKTVLAAAAAVAAMACGQQVVMMAPTELLAEQHSASLGELLQPLGLRPYLLTGRQTEAERRALSERLAGREAALVVGTHALFQQGSEFAHLGLVIIDEQHRFGVHQRMALRDKGSDTGTQPHQLIMTATPIPRTLAMSAYADLDTSVIDELPPGRMPVTTVAVPDTRRDQVLERVALACGEGRQAYWVCTLVEESEVQAQSAEATAQALREQLPELAIGLVHGRMKAPEKEAAMAAFVSGETQLLVATTVVEVGVDVANASLLVIENQERLGLAQLHQLRGRVGRGRVRSHCVLMYHPPLSEPARARLQALRATQDGFEIARQDLALRGPGEVLGTRQTGVLGLKVADWARDGDLLDDAQHAADQVLADYPAYVAPLMQRWLGDVERYAGV